jgi:hypothetical protein
MLLLQKQVAETLAINKLNNVTIKRSQTGHLIFITGCGRELFIISTISIPKKLTKAEREYAADIANTFITKNIKSFKELLKIRNIRDELQNNPPSNDNEKLSSMGASYVRYRIKPHFFLYYLIQEKTFTLETSRINLDEVIEEIKNIESYKEKLLAYNEYLNKLKDLNNKIAKLKACSL